jgi:simple sugar transport system permease protein
MERIMASQVTISRDAKRKLNGIYAMAIASIFSFVVFAYMPNVSDDVTYSFVLDEEWALIQQWVIDSRIGSYAFSIMALVFTAIAYLLFRQGKRHGIAIFGFSIGFFMAFLCWASAGDFVPFTGLLQGGLILAVPLVYGSLAGLVCERSGVINIAIEGQLLGSAFVAGITGSLLQNAWYGLIIAPFAGALVSLLLAVFAIKYRIDQVILGFVINVLIIGLTSFAAQRFLTQDPDKWNSSPILKPIDIPILSKLPIIGPMFFSQTIIIYLLYVIVVVTQIALFKSKWGLRMRSVGELPVAAESVGIDVNKVRFRNVIIAGAIAGLGGAFFTVGSVGSFSREMTAGMGFIALAALIFGRWTPLGALSAALVFGFADQLRSVLSIAGTPIPSAFMMMVPYIATIIAVSGFVGRVRAPAADGIPYQRGGSH